MNKDIICCAQKTNQIEEKERGEGYCKIYFGKTNIKISVGVTIDKKNDRYN